MTTFTWPCGCKSPAEGGDVTEPCDECKAERNEPPEPDEDDITTSDHLTFYASGREIVRVGADDDWRPAVRAWMERSQFYPNVWWISDHGNPHLLSLDD